MKGEWPKLAERFLVMKNRWIRHQAESPLPWIIQYSTVYDFGWRMVLGVRVGNSVPVDRVPNQNIGTKYGFVTSYGTDDAGTQAKV